MGERGAFRVDVVADDPDTCLQVVGEIDLATAPQLREQLTGATDDRSGDIIVDMSRVTFVDSTGLTTLVEAYRRLQAKGRRLRVSELSPATAQVMRLSGLTELLTSTPSSA